MAPPPPAGIVQEPGCEPEGLFAPLPSEADLYDPFTTGPAGGTPSALPNPKDQAKQSYNLGRRATDEQRWGDARRAFLESWSLLKSPYFAFALARTAVILGRPSEVLYYGAFVLRSAEPSEKQRAEALRLRAQAETQIAWHDVRSEPGACIAVDGVTVGRTPLGTPFLVDPGRHHVEVRHQGRRGREEVAASSAEVARVTLKLE